MIIVNNHNIISISSMIVLVTIAALALRLDAVPKSAPERISVAVYAPVVICRICPYS